VGIEGLLRHGGVASVESLLVLEEDIPGGVVNKDSAATVLAGTLLLALGVREAPRDWRSILVGGDAVSRLELLTNLHLLAGSCALTLIAIRRTAGLLGKLTGSTERSVTGASRRRLRTDDLLRLVRTGISRRT
jgi:hypothetical protein